MIHNGKLINPDARIETTTHCNTHCKICPRDKLTRKKCTMPIDHFKYLVDQCIDLGAEHFSLFGFGEPLMDKELSEKIAYCNEYEKDTFITSNGFLFTEDKVREIIDAGLKHIRFSCHGLYEDYKDIHGIDFDTVLTNIRKFAYINEMEFNHSCKVDVSIIPMHGERLADLICHWNEIADDIEIWRPHGWAGAMKYREFKFIKNTCGRPFSGPIQINADGNMMVCCFDFDGKMILGDTRKEKIEDILNGEALRKIRDMHCRTSKPFHLPCAECDQLYSNGKNPLLFSTIDQDCEIGKTSSIKYRL